MKLTAADLSGDEVLELLKSNDAQFDNVLVDYDYTRYEPQSPKLPKKIPIEVRVDSRIDSSALPSKIELVELWTKYVTTPSGGKPLAVPEEKKKWVSLLRNGKIRITLPCVPNKGGIKKTGSRNQLGLRWPDLAVRKQYGSQRASKFSVIDQKTHFLFPASGTIREWFLSTDVDPFFPNAYQENVIWLKFAFGIGYSDIISDVTSCEFMNGLYHLRVNIDWWSHLDGEGDLQLDDSLVVRAADISFGDNRVVVETTGIHKASERRFSCAKTGQIKKFRNSRLEIHFRETLQTLKFALTDEAFNELADMSTPNSEGRYEVNQNGVRQVRSVTSSQPGNPWRLNWLILQLIVIFVLVYLIVKKRFYAPA